MRVLTCLLYSPPPLLHLLLLLILLLLLHLSCPLVSSLFDARAKMMLARVCFVHESRDTSHDQKREEACEFRERRQENSVPFVDLFNTTG